MTKTDAIDLFNRALPAIAVILWLAIYVVYVWRDPEMRRWLERQVFQVSRRHRRPHAHVAQPPAPPVMFRPQPPGSAPPRTVQLASGRHATAAELAPPAAWQAAHLPMRYRLLGQVRAASNDN